MKIKVITIVIVSMLIGVILGIGINKWICLNRTNCLNDHIPTEIEPKEDTNEVKDDEEIKSADDDKYIWSYKDIEPYAEYIHTAVYDEIEDRYRLIEKSNVTQNAFASLLKKFGEKKAIDEYECFFGTELEDSTGEIESETSFLESEPAYLEKDKYTLELKYVDVHEDIYNGAWNSVKLGTKTIETLKEELKRAEASRDEESIKYYKDKIKEAEEIVSKMEKDPVITGIRSHCETCYDMTLEEKAHLAMYTTGYWDRPEDSHYAVTRVFIMNGDNRTGKYYTGQGRAKKLKIAIEDKEYIIDLEDTPECQIFDLDYKTNDIYHPVNIKVELLEAYPGDGDMGGSYYRYENDTAWLSSIKFEIESTVFVGGR